MKIWIKVYIDDKILHSTIIERKEALTQKVFEDIICQACHMFDYSTPIILSSHFNHFVRFNSTKFIPDDFIDAVDFTKFTAEYCIE